jgi:hypothetical protein
MLWVLAGIILFMGIASPLITSRTELSVHQVLEQMHRSSNPQPVYAQRNVLPVPSAPEAQGR